MSEFYFSKSHFCWRPLPHAIWPARSVVRLHSRWSDVVDCACFFLSKSYIPLPVLCRYLLRKSFSIKSFFLPLSFIGAGWCPYGFVELLWNEFFTTVRFNGLISHKGRKFGVFIDVQAPRAPHPK